MLKFVLIENSLKSIEACLDKTHSNVLMKNVIESKNPGTYR